MGCNSSKYAAPPSNVQTNDADCAKYYGLNSDTKINDLYDVEFKKKLGKKVTTPSSFWGQTGGVSARSQ